MSFIKTLIVGAFLLAAPLAPAAAAVQVYTISGTGSGSLNGTNFTNSAFSFSLTGDTATINNNIVDPLISATVNIAGRDAVTLLIPTRLGVSSLNTVFFSRAGANGLDLFDFQLSGPVNLATIFGPVTGTGVFALSQFQNISTTGGLLSFNSSSSVQFSSAAGAVPEPGTWAMMLLGFFGMGAVLRRRSRSAAEAAAYAA